MEDLRKDVLLLRNLVTFETVTRSENFTRAAEKLGLTRVAVSRQIADLEHNLGRKLFHRNHRQVSLTVAGRTLASTVNPALLSLSEGLRQIRNERSDTRLTVTTTAAFASYWLMPRLIDFGIQYPKIEINLVVTDKYLDLETEEIDIAIRYTQSEPTIGRVTRLLQENVFPVYSPKYQKNTNLTKAEHLFKERLLNLSGRYRAEARWPHWFKSQNLTPPEENAGVIVNTYTHMVQAAIEGQGVALAGFPLVNRFLEEGLLIKMEGVNPLQRDWFYLIERFNDSKEALQLCRWIRSQAGLKK